jgi:4'-phosphopantetheinyl transferase
MTILPGDAQVWLEGCATAPPTPDLDLLSADERRRAEEIRHARSRSHFQAGRILLRRALSQHAPIAPDAWVIETTSLGRPEIAGPHGAPDLRFNISHSGDLVACVVTGGIDCGIDLEVIDRPVDVLAIARHSFDAAEAKLLEMLDMPSQAEHFFTLWTLKEAYVKARGAGIRLRLDSARFEVSSSGLITAALGGSERTAREWHFSLFEPSPGYRLALALQSGESAPGVEFRSFDRTGKARPHDVPTLASSAP